MRALLFRKLLQILRRHTPHLLIRFQLQILLNTTARAFGLPGKSVLIYPEKRALREYASFTADCMRRAKADPARLYREAYRLGKRLRRFTGFTQDQDKQELVFYLYQNISITMRGKLPGTVYVPACYFSQYYTPDQCKLMSYVDSGIIAGILGRGELHFTQRITEGSDCCMASFERREGRCRRSIAQRQPS